MVGPLFEVDVFLVGPLARRVQALSVAGAFRFTGVFR